MGVSEPRDELKSPWARDAVVEMKKMNLHLKMQDLEEKKSVSKLYWRTKDIRQQIMYLP